jgi:pimeloyl-ACP methyl ester carboxylesterase
MPLAQGVNFYTTTDGKQKPVDIYYTLDGPENGEVVILLIGLGMQSLHWHWNTIVSPLVDAGYRVLRIDNRELGLSSKLHDIASQNFYLTAGINRINGQSPDHQLNYPLEPSHPIHSFKHDLSKPIQDSDYFVVPGTHPRIFMECDGKNPHRAQYPHATTKTWLHTFGFGKQNTPWDLADCAMDVILLCDRLGIDRFHLHGMSMGGMISQYICALVPSRVLSLTLTMSSSGNINFNPDLIFLFFALALNQPPMDNGTPEQWIKWSKRAQESLGYPDPNRTYNNCQNIDEIITGIVTRAKLHSVPFQRQIVGLESQECRDYIMDFIAARIPMLIFHGKNDPLIPVGHAHHMLNIAKHSLQRQCLVYNINRDEHDEHCEVKYFSTKKLDAEIVTIIGAKYNGRPVYTTQVILDKAGHDLSDHVYRTLTPQLIYHLSTSTTRADIELCMTQQGKLPVPVFGTQPNIRHGCEDDDEDKMALIVSGKIAQDV